MSNPLTVLVNQYLSKNNLSRNNLAELLGYKNIPKGLRNLDAYCITLKDTNNISKKLPQVLNIPAYEFENAVYDVQSKLELKKRGTFLPSLQVIFKQRPPVFSVVMFPKLLNIEMPEVYGCNFEEELELICSAYLNHQKTYSNSNGFRYYRTYNQTLVFSENCKLIDEITNHIQPSKATLSIGGKTIPPSILGTHNEQV